MVFHPLTSLRFVCSLRTGAYRSQFPLISYRTRGVRSPFLDVANIDEYYVTENRVKA